MIYKQRTGKIDGNIKSAGNNAGYNFDVQAMKHFLPFRLITVTLCCLFILFVVIYGIQTKQDMQAAIEQHGHVVSASLWNLDQQAQAEYLAVVAQLYDYEKITVLDHQGETFLTANSTLKHWHEIILLSLGLIPKIYLTSPITYDGNKIGTINAVWHCKTIYTYFYVLCFLFLIITILYFYNRLMKSNILLEDRVEERTQVLKESENKYRLLSENTADVIWTTDMALNPTFISPSITALRGITVEEAMEESMEEKVSPALLEKIKMAKETTTDLDTPIILEGEQPCKDGSTVRVEMSISYLYDESGNKTGFIGTTRDITERKRAEEEKRELELQLRQSRKLEAIGTLAGGIAHDFNNLLGVIIGYTDLAKVQAPTDSKFSQDLDKVLQAGNRAKDLVQQILAFSSQAQLEKKPLAPYPIIKEALKLLRSSIPSTIEIQDNISRDCGVINADPTQLHQILMNLCTNAFHAMEENGGILSVELKVADNVPLELIEKYQDSEAVFLELSVSDTGQGISPEIIERIFDPFFTTKEEGRGTGMGLSITYGIVKEFGGTITLDSELGKGTTFQIYLPRSKQEAVQTISIDDASPAGNEKILFVDDEELLINLGKEMLERLGYHVTIKMNSVEALQTFQNQPDDFDLLITDQTMPGITGLDLARRILQIRPDIPVILCTGYSALVDEDVAKAQGIKGFAHKPFTINSLGKLIRQVLDEEQSAC